VRTSLNRKESADRFDRPIVRQLRELCLSLPETSERLSWGHPNFRAGKRTFVAFEVFNGKPSIAFRLDRVNVSLLLGRKKFFATPYGRGQWVSLQADGVLNWKLVTQLVNRSYRTTATKRMVNQLDGHETKRPGSSSPLCAR
jgi:predicted DNA-binding protein (MmcQ/YjbR family)